MASDALEISEISHDNGTGTQAVIALRTLMVVGGEAPAWRFIMLGGVGALTLWLHARGGTRRSPSAEIQIRRSGGAGGRGARRRRRVGVSARPTLIRGPAPAAGPAASNSGKPYEGDP